MKQGETVELKLDLSAPPEKVYQALVDPDELNHWFAEYSDVSLPDNRYRFWGRFTPEAPSQDTVLQSLLKAIPFQHLSYTWHLHARDTTVAIDLEEVNTGTRLNLKHHGVRPNQFRQYIMGDYWSLALESLRGWVERRSKGTFCDFADIQSGEVVKITMDIDAPSEKVFQSLIQPSELNRYIAENAQVEPKVGGVYTFGWESGGPVKILDLEPNKRLSLSWEYADETETIVTWSLEGSGGRTQLTLVHSGFAASRENADYQIGWTKYINQIKSMVEVGPDWQKPEFLSIDL